MEIFCPGKIKRRERAANTWNTSHRVTECVTATESTSCLGSSKIPQSNSGESKTYWETSQRGPGTNKEAHGKSGFRLRVKFKNSDSCHADLMPNKSDDDE